MIAIRRPMASRPWRSRSMATVDNEGVPKRASSSSSQPNTLRSPGTFHPRLRLARTAPIASTSLAATTAVIPVSGGRLITAS